MGMFDYSEEDRDMLAELDARGYGEEEADMYNEEYEIRRDEQREEMEYYKQAQEDAAEDAARLRMLASTCPKCGKDCGEADYDPPDPSVGIFGGVYGNECPKHGIFFTYDDGAQEVE